jgi:uncharacterized protein YkwD
VICLSAFAAIFTAAGCATTRAHSAAELHEKRANERIDFDNLDTGFLAQCIFDRTNRVRGEHGGRPFVWLDRAAEAASIQVVHLASTNSPSHENPRPNLRRATDRALHVGLFSHYLAENVSSATALDIGEHGSYIAIFASGRWTAVHPVTREPIALRTYADFARFVVDRWMASPGHRINILSRQLTHLGCAVRPSRDGNGVPYIHSVQVFSSSPMHESPPIPAHD